MRAGFHPDCLHARLDKCFVQIELTLNIVRPYDNDPTKSAYYMQSNIIMISIKLDMPSSSSKWPLQAATEKS